MRERFTNLGLTLKADVLAAHIQCLEAFSGIWTGHVHSHERDLGCCEMPFNGERTSKCTMGPSLRKRWKVERPVPDDILRVNWPPF